MNPFEAIIRQRLGDLNFDLLRAQAENHTLRIQMQSHAKKEDEAKKEGFTPQTDPENVMHRAAN